MRKTIAVDRLRELVNDRLAANYLDAEGRKAVADFMADVLHETGNYHGFVYTDLETDLHADHFGKDGRVRFL